MVEEWRVGEWRSHIPSDERTAGAVTNAQRWPPTVPLNGRWRILTE